MVLKNIKQVGRYRNPNTKRFVNVKSGDKVGYGTTVLYYLRRGSRVIIGDKEFYSKWKK